MQILFQETFCLFYLDSSQLMKIILVCKKGTLILQKFEARTAGATFGIFWC
mgnify:CR=1 FL=1